MDLKNKGYEIAALILGAASIPLACLWAIVGIVVGAAGLVVAILGRRYQKTPLLTAAIIFSVLGILAGAGSMLIMIVFYIMAVK